ncbi:hypothetical protein [Couchioplanes caeruleus]|uniref:Uncharacterized protein n=2 Tax=Couchioplanes caeruleus TaxID=56438 RepID=A0A1K0FD09_9ACTN|nr:hypothetical protein [Couchioplanes caeruleus]OJF10727.1 hypothetical protein BG844_30485 [Couchioplanes caeruleus subsp. caeruleus]ROP31279.1 hypothetical protein EDD30_4174 [Couchioplanes caeruleus]
MRSASGQAAARALSARQLSSPGGTIVKPCQSSRSRSAREQELILYANAARPITGWSPQWPKVWADLFGIHRDVLQP